MPCMIHPDEPEIGTCTRCGRVMCERCRTTAVDKPLLCSLCLPMPGTAPQQLGKLLPWTLLALLALAAVVLVGVVLLTRLLDASPLIRGLLIVVALGVCVVAAIAGFAVLRRRAVAAVPRPDRQKQARQWAEEFAGPFDRPSGTGARLRDKAASPETIAGLAVIVLVFALPALVPSYREWLRGVADLLKKHVDLVLMVLGGLFLLWQLSFLQLAQFHIRRGDYRRALRAIDWGLKLKPRSADLLTASVDVYLRQGRLDEAEIAARRQVRLEPTLPTSYSNLSAVLADLGQRREAEAAGQRALDLAPYLPGALVNMAWALAVRGEQLDRAVALAQAAQRISRTGAQRSAASVALAEAYRKLERLPEALAAAEEALRQAGTGDRPQAAAVYFELGTIQRAAGQPGAAVDSFRHIPGLDPHGRYAEPARSALWELGAGLKAIPYQ